MTRVFVRFSIDTNGLLQVSAQEITSGVKASISVKPTQGLSTQDQERLLSEGMQNAEEDKNARQYLEDKLEAERELEALNPALRDFAHLLSEDQAQSIKGAMLKLEEAISNSQSNQQINQIDHKQVRTAHENLKKFSDPFAAAIMNQAVSTGLSGKTPDQI